MERIEGRNAVVIGGGSGVGRGIALALADAGARVVVADIESDPARAVAATILERGGTAVAVAVDGTDRAELAALAERATAELGPVHILSNNVGVMVDAPAAEATETEWAWIIELNLMSLVRAVGEFVGHLRHGEGAHIVNTASMAALFAGRPEQVGGAHLGLYTATKHAVLGWSEILRAELAPEGIGVSVLCPGLVDSNLAATSMRNRPERYGGPVEAEDYAGGMPGAMDNEIAGRMVVEGIRGDRLHILTHPAESAAVIEPRAAALVADVAYAAEAATRVPGHPAASTGG